MRAVATVGCTGHSVSNDFSSLTASGMQFSQKEPTHTVPIIDIMRVT